MNTSAWYHLPVDFVVSRNLMNGTGADTFDPNGQLTRAMLVTILYRYEGEPAVSGTVPFQDVSTKAYYYDAVRWAAANGIVKGTSATTYAPNQAITREQMVVILYRYAQMKKVDVSAQGKLDSFPDSAKVSGYAKEALAWAVSEGIINGDDGYLKPQGTATRAQVAAVLQRYIENVIED